MKKASLQFGNGNWAYKESTEELLAYRESENGKFGGAVALNCNKKPGPPQFQEDEDVVLTLEPQSTNLITYSEDFTDVSWSKVNGGVGSVPIVTSNQGISPKGDLTADRVQFDLGGGTASSDFSIITNSVTVSSGATTTKSIYLKSNDSGTYNCIIYDGITGDEKEIVVTNEWQKFILTNSVPSTTSSLVIGLRNAFGVIGQSNVADVLVWGSQLEQQPYATSYIKTEGATATRIVDTLSKTGLENYINSSEGVFYFEGSALFNTLVNRQISISNGSLNNRVSIAYSNASNLIVAFIVSGGVTQETLTYSKDITENSKIAVKYSNGSCSLWIDGIERDSGNTFTSFASLLNELESGRGNGTDLFFAETKDIRVYNTALTDAEIQTLTT